MKIKMSLMTAVVGGALLISGAVTADTYKFTADAVSPLSVVAGDTVPVSPTLTGLSSTDDTAWCDSYATTIAGCGTYLGLFDGNDDLENVKDALESLRVDYVDLAASLTLTGKSDAEGDEALLPINTFIQKVDNTEAEDVFGSWGSAVDPTFDDLQSIVTVKSSTSFTMWLFDPAVTEGNWTTEGIEDGKIKGISHFSGFSSGVTPVPLPAAAWLFGSALIGAGIVGRRKKKAA